MNSTRNWKGCGLLCNYLRADPNNKWFWELRLKHVCASTEIEMTSWLKHKPMCLDFPRAFLAKYQNFAFGQRGRVWDAPVGGVWLSAAIPFANRNSASILRLALAVALAEQLEIEGIKVQIKWPNDLIVNKKKIAGILTKLIYRGDTIRFARIGLGLNVYNKTPKEGISLKDICIPTSHKIDFWAARSIVSIERAVEICSDNHWLLNQVKKRLCKEQIINPEDGALWDIYDISIDGNLVVKKNNIFKSITR